MAPCASGCDPTGPLAPGFRASHAQLSANAHSSAHGRTPVRWITQLEKAGITTIPQYLSLGDKGSEVRTALADLLAWPASTPVNIPKLAKGVVPAAAL